MDENQEPVEELGADAIEQAESLNEEKKTRRKKAAPAKSSTSSPTEKARAAVRAKLAAR